ncbi:hypothetical protein Athai_38700 [Actinocatenispora thailandica]|uniref:Histidine phosphatase family protein n=1 Tax=Actinocatenispora thailandica TaxID=227318 RepID=A0A7R7HXN2_9ACTN|nr:histidine phosphatase family protein [Actinocatenispora thailandica]BCJ36367.1 hypothetical protein Athai_38700 [Actinocatenispora thailandica]
MVTYVLRHGRTAYSASYRVNGDPQIPVYLDRTGRVQCREARDTLPPQTLASCVSSPFPRAIQTARLLTADRPPDIQVDPSLGEIDYGEFEGGPFTAYARWLTSHGPHARPAGAGESQHEALTRMLRGLRRCLQLPGPRLVVTHGLLLSVLAARRLDGHVCFPEALYATPRLYSDHDLTQVLDRLLGELAACPADSSLLPVREPGQLDTFGPTSAHPEEEDAHA